MDNNFNTNTKYNALTAKFLVLSSQITVAQTAEAAVELALKFRQSGSELEDVADQSWSNVYRIASELNDQKSDEPIETLFISAAELVVDLLTEPHALCEIVAAKAKALRVAVVCKHNHEVEAALQNVLEFTSEHKGLPWGILDDVGELGSPTNKL